jgi:hypothetical protein|eukprot:COSAG01_NODE_6770_length_3506_cov_51.170825_5_plen_329_part_00
MPYTHKIGALGGGNDIAKHHCTIPEAIQRALALPGCKGFTFFGTHPTAQGQRVECFFKSSDVGNDDPQWQTYMTPYYHKVGALGGGNDLRTQHCTIPEAIQLASSTPNCKGFTFFGTHPTAQGQRVECFFKSSDAGNDDPQWQTYMMSQRAHQYRGMPVDVAAPAAPMMHGRTKLLNPPEHARTYSSIFGGDRPGHGHARSMLDSQQGWSAQHANYDQWMVIDAGERRHIYGTVISGRGHSAQGQKVARVRVAVSDRKGGPWHECGEFDCTTTHEGEKRHVLFKQPVAGRFVRLNPRAFQEHPSMRCAPARSPILPSPFLLSFSLVPA